MGIAIIEPVRKELDTFQWPDRVPGEEIEEHMEGKGAEGTLEVENKLGVESSKGMAPFPAQEGNLQPEGNLVLVVVDRALGCKGQESLNMVNVCTGQ